MIAIIWAHEICRISEKDPNIKAIRFTKNYGQGIAITAGIAESCGDCVVTMDCDLQDKPEMIPQLYEKVKDGLDRNDTIHIEVAE